MFWERKEVGPEEEEESGRGKVGGGEGWKGGKLERQEWQTLRNRRNSMRSLSFSPITGQSSTGRLDQSTVVESIGIWFCALRRLTFKTYK